MCVCVVGGAKPMICISCYNKTKVKKDNQKKKVFYFERSEHWPNCSVNLHFIKHRLNDSGF